MEELLRRSVNQRCGGGHGFWPSTTAKGRSLTGTSFDDTIIGGSSFIVSLILASGLRNLICDYRFNILGYFSFFHKEC